MEASHKVTESLSVRVSECSSAAYGAARDHQESLTLEQVGYRRIRLSNTIDPKQML